jgi:hypothetical protein
MPTGPEKRRASRTSNVQIRAINALSTAPGDTKARGGKPTLKPPRNRHRGPQIRSADSLGYEMMLAAGYRDTWIEPGHRALGLTCCQQADLLNARSTFDQRIDFIFARNLTAGTMPVRRRGRGGS